MQAIATKLPKKQVRIDFYTEDSVDQKLGSKAPANTVTLSIISVAKLFDQLGKMLV